MRGFLDLLTVTFMAATGSGRCTSSAGSASFGAVGTAVLVYLTVLKATGGGATSHRPLLTLGVLLVVVGVQLVSSASSASSWRATTRSAAARAAERHVDEPS